jgi:hypothetical protein
MSLVLVAATVSRLVAWIKEPTIWRFATIVAFAALGLAWVMMVGQTAVDSWAGLPHLARLIGYLAGVCAAGAGVVYLLGLRTAETTKRAVVANVAITVIALLAVAVAWLKTPHHDVESPGLPLSWSLAIFNTVLLYLAYTALVGVIVYGEVVRRSQALSHRLGSAVAAVGFAVGLIMMVAVVARFYAGYLLPQAVGPLNVVFLIAAPIAAAGICGGTFLFIAGGRFVEWIDVIRVLLVLTPLWRLAIQRHPDVALPLHGIGFRPAALRFAAFRIRVEILDALRQTQVPPQTLAIMEPIDAVVHVLRHPDASHGSVPASQLVSGTDEEITAELAKAYRRSRRRAAVAPRSN